MHIKTRRISLTAILFSVFAISAFSQYNSFSPYTRFGLGNLAQGGFTQNQAMGGTGIAIRDDNKLNYLNPAAYSTRDSMSVLMDFGMNLSNTRYITENTNRNWWNANFHHIALSLPVGKQVGIGAGIVPYSSVGYKIKQEYNLLGTGDPVDFYNSGYGGILKFFTGASVQFLDRFSLGMNINYLLGDISRERSIIFPKSRGFADTEAVDDIRLSNTYLNFGFQYKEVFSDKFFFTVGATYDLETNLKADFSSYVTSYFSGSNGYLNDSIIYNYMDIRSENQVENVVIPAKIGLGIAFGIPNKLTITGDYKIQDWAAVDNSSFSIEGFNLATARSFHGGIEYTPDFEAFRGYHNLMSYRAGGFMNESYVKVGDYQLKEYGMTFGVGFPLGRTKSSLNIGATLGTRGTTENNLIRENYGILSFSLTLHDIWFIKRKYD